MNTDWEAVIGLEIHVQLSTRSKIFSGADTTFGAQPNTQASAVDLGLPGVLPVVNQAVFRKAVAFGLSIGGAIGRRSVFDRKNYFYPDLPKGYQITQMDQPIVLGGSVDITLEDGASKTIKVTRAHLEEDAGKSLHEDFHGMTGIDLNRAGIPLLEIVSEPDMHSAEEAVAYARAIHQRVTWLSVSDGKMAEGSLRCDANVSLRKKGDRTLGTRTETKNVNSFRFLEAAIRYEINRQREILEAGGRVLQETRLYDPDRDETRPMRNKETATDYRYFPEPDLPPVVIDEAYINAVRDSMPELPAEKIKRYTEEWQVPQASAQVIASSIGLATCFEDTVKVSKEPILAANWVTGELLAGLNREELDIEQSPVSAEDLGQLILRIKDGTLSGTMAKALFHALWKGEANSVDEYIEKEGLVQISDTDALAPVIDRIIADNPKQVEQYRNGKTKVLGFFVGQVMKETGGKANPRQVNELVVARLG